MTILSPLVASNRCEYPHSFLRMYLVLVIVLLNEAVEAAVRSDVTYFLVELHHVGHLISVRCRHLQYTFKCRNSFTTAAGWKFTFTVTCILTSR